MTTDIHGDTTVSPTRWWEGARPPAAWGSRVGQVVLRALARRWPVEVDGIERVPAAGPVILASNHMSLVDGPVLTSVSPRPVHCLVKQEMFTGTLRAVLGFGGQIPVDRWHVDRAAVRSSLAVLARDRVLAIYPEGRRGRGDLARVHGGVGYLALCTGAPVVPVACLGMRNGPDDSSLLPLKRQRLVVGFGDPVALETMEWPRTAAAVADATSRIASAMRRNLARLQERTGIALPPDLP